MLPLVLLFMAGVAGSGAPEPLLLEAAGAGVNVLTYLLPTPPTPLFRLKLGGPDMPGWGPDNKRR